MAMAELDSEYEKIARDLFFSNLSSEDLRSFQQKYRQTRLVYEKLKNLDVENAITILERAITLNIDHEK